MCIIIRNLDFKLGHGFPLLSKSTKIDIQRIMMNPQYKHDSSRYLPIYVLKRNGDLWPLLLIKKLYILLGQYFLRCCLSFHVGMSKSSDIVVIPCDPCVVAEPNRCVFGFSDFSSSSSLAFKSKFSFSR